MDFTAPTIAEGPAPLDVAIIGGGAAGVLVAIHLLRASAGRIRLHIIEPRPRLGDGVAYSTSDPNHLLNVRADGMSAFDDDPGHFVRYLAAERHGVAQVGDAPRLANRFVPRAIFGRYLRSTLAEYVNGRSVHLLDEAVEVTGAAPYHVALRSGRSIRAATVVLAVGNKPRPLEGPVAAEATSRVVHAWDYPAVAAIPADADVCIVGSGLSMVDVAVTLQAGGHRGRIRALSRHGLLPLPHARDRGPHGATDDALFCDGVLARTWRLRAEAAAGLRAGRPWQWTMDELRPHGRRLWLSLGEAEQRRFLRHPRPFWDVHRHRIAPEVAARLTELQRSRQLTLQAGRMQSIEMDGSRLRVGLQPRGSHCTEHLPADTVITCTGIESRLRRMRDPLMQALAAGGLASPGPLGLGLAVGNAAGALVTVDGRLQPQLLTLGSSRIGDAWESTAIPEIRKQADEITRWHLSGRLKTDPVFPAGGVSGTSPSFRRPATERSGRG